MKRSSPAAEGVHDEQPWSCSAPDHGAAEPARAVPDASNIRTSQYLANAINLGWLRGWKQKGWRRKDGELKNADLWQTLDGLLQTPTVQFSGSKATPIMCTTTAATRWPSRKEEV